MQYKLLLLDIDGTLRPGSCERVPKENAEAVCAVQRAGVKVAIATGRGRIGVGRGCCAASAPITGFAPAVRSWWTTRAAIWPCTG